MPETERLGYASGILEQLRASHEHMSREQLLDLVCHLNKTYVLDQTIPFDIPLPERADELRQDAPDAPPSPSDEENNHTDDPPERRFARLIEGLKRRTRLPQFDGFSVEDGRAVLIVDNQKVTFGERPTVEFVPTRQPRRPPTAPQRPPGAPQAEEPAPPSPAPPPRPQPVPAPRPAPPPHEEEEEEGYDASVERFKRLDLD